MALALCTGGCATTTETASADEDQEKVSTIPWNKPQKWENRSVGSTGVGY